MTHVVQAEISVEPMGTESTSISNFVAASEDVLQDYPDVRYQIHAMSTELEGELHRVFKVIERMHEAPFQQQAKRVVTTIRLDDRRDRENSMKQMVNSVQQKAQL